MTSRVLAALRTLMRGGVPEWPDEEPEPVAYGGPLFAPVPVPELEIAFDSAPRPAPSLRAVAAYRILAWDAAECDLAVRFFANCSGCRHVVLADREPPDGVDLGAAIVVHASGTSEFGLPDLPPGHAPWYNADYDLYTLRRCLPDFDGYVTAAPGVALNAPVAPLLDHVAARGVDFIAHDIRTAEPDWFWHANAVQAYGAPMRSFLAFTVASGRAIDTLLAARLREWQRFERGELAAWPFCEAFIPTTLVQAGLRVEGLGRFFDTAAFRFRPLVALDDPRASRAGALVHPVIGPARFMDAMLAEAPLRAWVSDSDLLDPAWKAAHIGAFAPRVAAAMDQAGDVAGLQLLRMRMREAGLDPDAEGDLAFCRPATTSSTSPWSATADPAIEGSRANGLETAEDCAFHTDEEAEPWWTVDLGRDFVVDRVEITNRQHCADRFRAFAIDSSVDGATWFRRHVAPGDMPVSSDIDAPHPVDFADSFVARHVRITLLGTGILHLRRVRVRGRRIEERGGAPL